eukprot:1140875-Pelagomonas_calceolata.AAC.2
MLGCIHAPNILRLGQACKDCWLNGFAFMLRSTGSVVQTLQAKPSTHESRRAKTAGPIARKDSWPDGLVIVPRPAGCMA